MHGEEGAGRLVDVHDVVRADCVLVHEPAQLDEEPLRVGLLQSKAVELLQALGGLLVAQAHAVEKPSDPPLAGTGVESLCVEPFEHVGHPHDVLAQPRHVHGRQHASPAMRCCSWRAPFPAIKSVRVDPVEHPGAQTLDLAQAPLHVPSPLSPPLVKHVEEPVAGDRVDVNLAALRTAAAGLVFNECSSSTGSLGVGELLVCERRVDGFSWSPPGRPLQADAVWELVVLEDVVLQSIFPELVPAGASGRPPPLDWWPTQTNRQGDGGALGPHDVERGGIQVERRRGALADEAVHRGAVEQHFAGTKHLFVSGKAEKNNFFMIQTVTSWKQTCRSR